MDQKQQLEKIDSLRKEIDSLRPPKPEYEKAFWDKFRLEFNYNSNHLEGNTLTYDHTQLLLLFDKVDGDYSLRELEEMKAHDVAFKVTKEGALEIEHILTEQFIREINKTILVRPFYKEAITPDGQPTRRLIEPGQYKKFPNSVRLENGEIFNYAKPEETSGMMGDLIEWYRKETDSKELHPVQLAALFQYHFVRIHPFDDGNGRTSRLLMNYMLIRNGLAPVVIESADKKNYLAALNKADTGNIEAFVDYITSLSLRWQELYQKALKGEEIEEPGDFEKDLHLLKKKIKDGNEKIELVLTHKIFEEILSTYILEIILKVISKSSIFDDLFVNRKMNFYYYQDTLVGRKSRNIKTIIPINSDEEHYIFEKIKSISKLATQNDRPLIHTFYFEYSHNYLKNKNLADFSYTSTLKFTFNTANYLIKLNNDGPEMDKLYNEKTSESEINEFAEHVTRKELKEIRTKI